MAYESESEALSAHVYLKLAVAEKDGKGFKMTKTGLRSCLCLPNHLVPNTHPSCPIDAFFTVFVGVCIALKRHNDHIKGNSF